MTAPAKSWKFALAATVLVVLLSALASPTFADTKPRFVYVANSGQTGEHTIATYSVTASAICGDSQCFQPIAISGTFTVDLTTSTVTGGTMYMTDALDLASSPLAVPFDSYRVAAFTLDSAAFFLVPGRTSRQSPTYVQLVFPFINFPAYYSGGPLCTYIPGGISTIVSPGCSTASGAEIGTANVNPNLYPTTLNGTNLASAYITSGSLTLISMSNGFQPGNVSGYAVDAATGALSPVPGSPFAAGTTPDSVAVDPSNKFVYVANQGSNNISAYTIDSATGALTPVSGSPFAAGIAPVWVSVDPSGKFIYVANHGSNNVSAFSVNTSIGALTPVSGSPFPAGDMPVSVGVDPAGPFVYVSNSNLNTLIWTVSGYTMDSSTGILTALPSSLMEAKTGLLGAAFPPSGKFLYQAGNFGTSWGISPYTVNSATGGLVQVGGCVAPCPNSKPTALAVDPTGKFLYVADAFSNYISAQTIDPITGQLGLGPGSPSGDFGSGPFGSYAAGGSPKALVVDPSGKFLYVANTTGNDVTAYTIDPASGALGTVTGSPFVAGTGPRSLAVAGAPASATFKSFKVKVDIDQDRRTSFRVEGFFTLGDGSSGIDPESDAVKLQVGSYTVSLPAGSFRDHDRHDSGHGKNKKVKDFKCDGEINDVDLRILIVHVKGNDCIFTAEGRGHILQGIKNPVTVVLSIGDNEGTATVKADIDR